MPLTDQEVADIVASENPLEHEALKPLAEKKMVVRTEAGETAFLERHKTDVIEKEIPTKINEVHTKYDNDIKALTGIDREQNEKTYDYLKRSVNSTKSTLQSKIDTLEEAAKKGGDPDGVFQRQIDDLQESNKTLTANLQVKTDEIVQLQGKFQAESHRQKVMEVYSPIKATFKKDLPDYFSYGEQQILDKVVKNSKLHNGVLIALNEDGTIMKDTSLNPITVEQVLKSEFKDAITTNVPGGTGGTGSSGNVDLDKITSETFELPANIKSQEQLTDHLFSIGLPNTDPKFKEIYKKHSKGLPLRV